MGTIRIQAMEYDDKIKVEKSGIMPPSNFFDIFPVNFFSFFHSVIICN